MVSYICDRFSTLSHQLPGLLQNCTLCLGEVYTPEEQCLISLSYTGQVCCPRGVAHLWWVVSCVYGSGLYLCHPVNCFFHVPSCSVPKHFSTCPPLRAAFYFPNNRNVNNQKALKILQLPRMQPPQHLNNLFFFSVNYFFCLTQLTFYRNWPFTQNGYVKNCEGLARAGLWCEQSVQRNDY